MDFYRFNVIMCHENGALCLKKTSITTIKTQKTTKFQTQFAFTWIDSIRFANHAGTHVAAQAI